MKTNRFKLEKRIKLVQVGFIINIFLVLIAIWQLFFAEAENFRKTVYWFIFILWTVVGILNWFQIKALKKELKKESQIEESPIN